VFFARWGFSHVALALLFYFALFLAGFWVFQVSGVSLAGDAVAQLVFEAALQGAVVLLVLGFARRLDPASWRSLGMWPGKKARAVAVGLLAYAIAAPGIFGLMYLWGWLLGVCGIEAEPQPIVELALGLEGWRMALFAVLAIALVPLCEEIFFRAFLQPLLVQNLGDRGGIALTAVLFAAVHRSLFAFLPILALALVLGLVMLRTQRLVAAWSIHALHNGLQIGLLLLEPQLREMVGG
jgi:membrane protease YdiL (CAAX protease family)